MKNTSSYRQSIPSPFTFSFTFPDQLPHWTWFHRHRKADRKVRSIHRASVWRYGLLTNNIIASPFSISCARQPKVIHFFDKASFFRGHFILLQFVVIIQLGFCSFVTVKIPFPELYVELDENSAPKNASKPVWMVCKDQRHRCKWSQVDFDVSGFVFVPLRSDFY